MLSLDPWEHLPVRERDAQGALRAAGFRWQQLRLIEQAGLGAAVLGLVVAAPIVHGAKGGSGAAAVLGIAGMLLAVLIWNARWPRVVLFTADGRVRTPNGIAGRFWVRDLGPIAQVSSIETTNACKDYGVVLFTTEGQTVLIAERMFRADARLVAVQLTKALQEMRASMARVGGGAARPAEMQKQTWVN